MAFDFFSRIFGKDADEDRGEGIRMVIGLGNPGKDYAGTRHNVGFMVLEVLCKDLGRKWSRAKIWQSELAPGDGLWLVKPFTFMNKSGTAVSRVSRHHKLRPDQVLVVFDDVSLPLGQLRFRAKGGHGGHNGMRDIIRALGTDAFPRLKVGIGQDGIGQDRLAEFVLGKFSAAERSELENAIPHARDAITHALEQGIESAMNQFNSSQAPPVSDQTN